ncbi:acyl-CoA thioesterase [Deltaproteobacteria bacterium OttesenSCG-928-K17]|nr:acyl-CoA thioesterase [Deltaproteobacteria bacterium OttesenSCG-928-K17]
MQGKKVSESATIVHQIPSPGQFNMNGTLHGGELFKMIDDTGGVAAMRHARYNVVTASMERMDFLTPVFLGELVILKSSVHLVGRTSMEVGVRVEVEDMIKGELRHAATCFLTYVAVDENGRPQPVPPLELETDVEHRRYVKAEERRRYRQSLAK